MSLALRTSGPQLLGIGALLVVLSLPYFYQSPIRICNAYIFAVFLTPNLQFLNISAGLPDLFGFMAVLALLGREWNKSRLLYLFGVGCAALLSILILPFTDPQQVLPSFLRAIRLMLPAAVAILYLLQTPQKKDVLQTLRMLLLFATVGAIFALGLFASKATPPWPHADQYIFLASGDILRGQGFLGESASLANQALLVVSILVIAGDLLMRKSAQIICFIFLVAAIIISLSRTAIIALAILVLYSLFFNRPKKIWPAAISILSFVVVYVLFPSISSGLGDRILQTVGGGSSQDLSSGRFQNWSSILDSLNDPWLLVFGHGYKSITFGNTGSDSELFGDNILISSIYETGVVGLLFILGFLFAIFLAVRRLTPVSDIGIKIRSALSAWFLVEIISCMSGDVLTFSRTLGPWFIVLAALISISNNVDDTALDDTSKVLSGQNRRLDRSFLVSTKNVGLHL